MSDYWWVASILMTLASLFVLWPLLRPAPTDWQKSDPNRADNIHLFEQQKQDMQADLAAGNLSETEYAERQAELERGLLEDLKNQQAGPKIKNRGAYLLLLTALLTPLSGWFLYTEWGAGNGMQQRQNMLATRAIMQSSESMEQLLVELQANLQEHPNNPEGWFILANYLLQNQLQEESLQAFQLAKQYAVEGSPERASILGNYAQALFVIDGAFSERVSLAINEAINANPNDVSALSLLGIQAYEAENFSDAIRFWEQALAASSSGEGAESLATGIRNARQQLAQQQSGVEAGPVIELTVRLANGLQVPTNPEAVLFVYARPVGQAMPLLATRLDPSTLPLRLQLNNTMALLPDTNLADYTELEVVAHIAKAGTPPQINGDLVGQVNSVSVAAQEVVDLVINRIVSGQ